jgi:hypothetical protein
VYFTWADIVLLGFFVFVAIGYGGRETRKAEVPIVKLRDKWRASREVKKVVESSAGLMTDVTNKH